MRKTLGQPERDKRSRFCLQVSLAGDLVRIPFAGGLSVREILDPTAWRVRSACGGIGACGQCLIRVEAGNGNGPSKTERAILSLAQIQKGLRLACQFKPSGDAKILIESRLPEPGFRLLPGSRAPRAFSTGIGTDWRPGHPYGVAVDLGTTQIRLSCFDLAKSRWISGRIGRNPQAAFGADVLTRLEKARESRDSAYRLSLLARAAIAAALRDIAAKEKACDPEKIGHLTVVGNTPMLAMLVDKNQDLLLQPEYWARQVDCVPADTRQLASCWGLAADARIEIVQPLAGFVGSDLLAGVLATDLIEGPAGSLLIDVGTNSEMALWDGAHLWISSAAGGPAFEGCGISCGMPAEQGAVYRADLDLSAAQFNLQVLGGGPARGLCGSGLLDAIAGLVRMGVLKVNGRFKNNGYDQGCGIGKGNPGMRLRPGDIDAFQRAKAAIGAGIVSLLKIAHMLPTDLQRICVCGAFGHFLHIANAQAVGLLPAISAEKIALFGHAALTGCEILLFSAQQRGILDDVRHKANIVNLAALPEFEDLFIQNLYLRPMHVEE